MALTRLINAHCRHEEKIRPADLGYRFRTAQKQGARHTALPQNQFLIDAVVASGGAAPAIKSDPFKVRTLWIIDLFETLRERDRDARIARIR